MFIPAGRNLITLLSTQLNYIFTSLEGTQLSNIDYITKRYTELILKLKPSFESGMAGLVRNVENDPEQMTQGLRLHKTRADGGEHLMRNRKKKTTPILKNIHNSPETNRQGLFNQFHKKFTFPVSAKPIP